MCYEKKLKGGGQINPSPSRNRVKGLEILLVQPLTLGSLEGDLFVVLNRFPVLIGCIYTVQLKVSVVLDMNRRISAFILLCLKSVKSSLQSHPS